MKQWQHIFLGILLGLCLAAALFLLIGRPKGHTLLLSAAPTASVIFVHIDGQINQPGVYQLPPGSRVIDVIGAAGGFTDTANTAAINQADFLTDGSRIIIPEEGQEVSIEAENYIDLSGQTGAERININTAGEETLDILPDIGPITAEQIVLFRQENGNFVRIEDIMNVPGIGEATFNRIKDLITVE